MKITIRIDKNYGIETAYPACPQSRLLADLAGTKTLTRRALDTIAALGLIYDYFESAEPDYDLDVIAICCEFSEQSPAAIAADYSIEIDENENDEEIAGAVLSYLEINTHVIGETDDGKFVYIQF